MGDNKNEKNDAMMRRSRSPPSPPARRRSRSTSAPGTTDRSPPRREYSRGRTPPRRTRGGGSSGGGSGGGRSRSLSRSRSPGSPRRRYSKSRSPRRRSASGSPNSGNVLYFAGLSVETREQDLEDICNKYGSVSHVNIIYDPRSGESRGFGFIYMQTDKEADDVVANLNGRELDGKPLAIEKARRAGPRKATPGKYLGKLNNRSRYGGVRGDRFGDRRGYDYPPRNDPYERYSPPRYRHSPPHTSYQKDSPQHTNPPRSGTYRRGSPAYDSYDRRYR